MSNLDGEEWPSNQNSQNNDCDSQHTQNSSNNGAQSENLEPEKSEGLLEISSVIQGMDDAENNKAFPKELHFDINEGASVSVLEKEKEEKQSGLDTFLGFMKKRQTVLTYESRSHVRQPFQSKPPGGGPVTPKIPPPPAYYSPPGPRSPESEAKTSVKQEHHVETQPFYNFGQMSLFPDIFINAANWASYPSKIPANIPSSLAQLHEVETLFILQKINILDLTLLATYDDLDMYSIQNKNGESIYFAYETTSPACTNMCHRARGSQLHLLDLYQNEVIYMNKTWGCNFFLAFPLMEVYSPPMVPIGAVIKLFNPYREQLVIVNAEEKELFKIVRNDPIKNFFKCYEVTYTIIDLGPPEVIIGYIKRNFSDYFKLMFPTSDTYGISFPSNLDVKFKAILLGALFLLSLKRTGWVLRNVEDPETVSGHMYRMSIMTFLIPESSGVDKTRCMKLSLVHDLAECIVGDLTPYCGVDTTEKHRQEEVAMKELTQMIGDSGAEIYTLYKEYEAQVTEESKFVKDLDRLDMILQAFEYEKLGDKPGKLEEFFTSTINKFHFPWTIDIVKEIYKQRNLHINQGKTLGKAMKMFKKSS